MRRAGAATLFAIAGALAGCQSLQTSENFLGILTPYRVEVVQGNVITSEQVALAKPGLTRAQVREVLGSPLLTDPFHADRWDYYFSNMKGRTASETKLFSVHFKDDKVVSFGGTNQPPAPPPVGQAAPPQVGR